MYSLNHPEQVRKIVGSSLNRPKMLAQNLQQLEISLYLCYLLQLHRFRPSS